MKNTFEKVAGVVIDEREYQDQRWPGHNHGVGSFLTYMWHYYRIAEQLDSTSDTNELLSLTPIRKLAALGVACMEQNGIVSRKRGTAVLHPCPSIAVYDAIREERSYQATNYPDREPNGNPLETSEELSLIRTYLADADQAWSKNRGDAQALNELRKVTAIAFRCMQTHGAPRRTILSNHPMAYGEPDGSEKQ